MDKNPSPYKISSFVTFRRHSKDRILYLGDVRLSILARYVRVSSKDAELGERLLVLLSAYDVLLKAEEDFFAFLTDIVQEHENG